MVKRIISFFIVCMILIVGSVGQVQAASVQVGVEFSVPGGFYGKEFDLVLTAPGAAAIYYTLNGDVPTETTGILYESPIEIYDRTSVSVENSLLIKYCRDDRNWDVNMQLYPYTSPTGDVIKGMVVRAVAYYRDGTHSKVQTQTYMVRENYESYFSNIPVIFITAPKDQFFGTGTLRGIYNNHQDRNLEYIMDVQMFENLQPVIASDARVKIQGAYSRLWPQKSFNIDFTKAEDYESIQYDLFGDYPLRGDRTQTLQVVDRFRLHMGGNDGQYTTLADALCQSLAMNLKVPFTNYRPTLVFLNGEFWGYYGLRESYSKDYFYDHFRIQGQNLIFLEIFAGCNNNPTVNEGLPSDINLYHEMYNYIYSHSMTNDTYYQTFSTMFDIDTFIDTWLVQLFSANIDWPGNNSRMFRVRQSVEGYPYQDGKWYYALHDIDWGFKEVNQNTIIYHMGDEPVSDYMLNPEWATIYMRKLTQNDDFMDRYVNRLLYTSNTCFAPEILSVKVESWINELLPYVADQRNRWAQKPEDFQGYADQIRRFAQGRRDILLQQLTDYFQLGDEVYVSLLARDAGQVAVHFGDNVLHNAFAGTNSIVSLFGREMTIQVDRRIVPNFSGFCITDSNGNSMTIEDTEYTFVPDNNTTIEVLYSGEEGSGGLDGNYGGTDDITIPVKKNILIPLLLGGVILAGSVAFAIFVLIKNQKGN